MAMGWFVNSWGFIWVDVYVYVPASLYEYHMHALPTDVRGGHLIFQIWSYQWL